MGALRSPTDLATSSETQIVDKGSSDCVLPKLNGDERRFLQVMINLVKNAIKFTSNGKIEIKACYDRDEGQLIIHV